MKKTLFCMFFALLGFMQLNAQIQRTFLGCSFGTSKQVVLQKMKAKGFTVVKNYNGFIVNSTQYNKISFGGFIWDEVQFVFYKDALNGVNFVCYSDLSSSESIIGFYKLLNQKLESKYANYSNTISDDICSWSDGKTFVSNHYTYIDRKGNIVERNTLVEKKMVWCLIYEDFLSPKNENDDSEL